MSYINEIDFSPRRRSAASFEAARLLWLLAAASGAVLAWQLFRPMNLEFAGLSIDRLSAVAGLFVAVVGAVVHRFASRSMEGHPARARFLALLAFATCMAFLVSCASNLLLMAVAWVLLSAAVHQLLVFGGDTRSAWRAARRKFLVARIGEMALFGAIGLLWWHVGSLEIGACVRVADGLPREALVPIASLLVIAAMARSVQVPFHAWLPDTMEAPTPVSALLHAGIVNAGGILLIRFAPFVVRVPEACLLLSVIGTITVVMGVLAMQQQLRVKQALAWSTVAQMGFLVVQCAVAAFPAALLHLIGHGAYKAMAFLQSGETPKRGRALGPAWWNVMLLVSGATAAIACMGPAARWTGFDPRHAPGEMALALVVAIGVGQAWIAALGACGRGAGGIARGIGIAAVSALASPVLCFAAYRAAGIFLQPVIGELPQATGPLMSLAAALPALAITMLALANAAHPWLEHIAAWRSMQVQARSGFHMGARLDRALDAFLPAGPTPETRHA